MRLAVLISLALLSAPALALETLSSKHFSVEYGVSPREECFMGGEKVSVNYEISPKSSAYRALLGGEEGNARSYYFKTQLSDASWRLVVNYYQGGAWDEAKSGGEVSIEAKYFKIGEDVKGIEKVTANLTAVVPTCSVRLCNLTAVNASCEECESDALPGVRICVANENAFRNDLRSLRAKLSELEQKLRAEGLYSEEDFRKVKDAAESAENYLLARNFLRANEKISEAESLLKQLADLTNKKIAENLYSEVRSKLDEIQSMLVNSSLLLEKLRAHENYSRFLLDQEAFKNELNALRDSIKNVDSLMNGGKFTEAIEALNRIDANATSLKGRLNDFISLLTSESEKQASWIPLPTLSLTHLAFLVAAIAALAIFVALRLRRKRKWDELR